MNRSAGSSRWPSRLAPACWSRLTTVMPVSDARSGDLAAPIRLIPPTGCRSSALAPATRDVAQRAGGDPVRRGTDDSCPAWPGAAGRDDRAPPPAQVDCSHAYSLDPGTYCWHRWSRPAAQVGYLPSQSPVLPRTPPPRGVSSRFTGGQVWRRRTPRPGPAERHLRGTSAWSSGCNGRSRRSSQARRAGRPERSGPDRRLLICRARGTKGWPDLKRLIAGEFGYRSTATGGMTWHRLAPYVGVGVGFVHGQAVSPPTDTSGYSVRNQVVLRA